MSGFCHTTNGVLFIETSEKNSDQAIIFVKLYPKLVMRSSYRSFIQNTGDQNRPEGTQGG